MMHWTYQEYQDAPVEFVEAIIKWSKKDAES